MASFEKLRASLRSHPSPSFGAGARESEIQEAERQLGVPIKGSYRLFVLEFGWGGAGPYELFGLGAGVPRYLELVSMTHSEREEMGLHLRHSLLPIMNDGGGNLYCVDTAAGDEPPIVFWDHEGSEDQVVDVDGSSFADWFKERVDE